MASPETKALGALIGLAVGDALGTTVEFMSPGTFSPVVGMTGGGPFRLKPGEWTDDTSMALCLAESLVECGGFDANDQCERYVKWLDEGYMGSNGRCFDVGVQTSRALRAYKATHDPYSGPKDARSAGNGSLMRLAPVPIYYMADPAEAVRVSGESSRTTHGAAMPVDACRYYGGLIVGALRGVPKEELLSTAYSPVHGLWDHRPLHPDVMEVAMGSFKTKEPPEIVGSGYVIKSMEAALWAFYASASFREGCLMAVNLGDDADTTAAIFGQLAGAYYGLDGIPAEWRGQLARPDLLHSLAQRLWVAAQRFGRVPTD